MEIKYQLKKVLSKQCKITSQYQRKSFKSNIFPVKTPDKNPTHEPTPDPTVFDSPKATKVQTK